MELVYDLHLMLFGVREVAEKELHSFFQLVRRYAPRHPRVRTFALFCGIPMTLTASTRSGFFNLDVHLESAAKARVRGVSSSVDAAPTAAGAWISEASYWWFGVTRSGQGALPFLHHSFGLVIRCCSRAPCLVPTAGGCAVMCCSGRGGGSRPRFGCLPVQSRGGAATVC